MGLSAQQLSQPLSLGHLRGDPRRLLRCLERPHGQIRGHHLNWDERMGTGQDLGRLVSVPRIKAGRVGFEVRRLVAGMLRPRLKVEKAFLWREEVPTAGEPESLYQLIRLDFQPAEHPPPEEIRLSHDFARPFNNRIEVRDAKSICRMTAKQQMRWSPKGAHFMLKVRTSVMNGTFEQDHIDLAQSTRGQQRRAA
jgi:hypothetical protein